MVWGHQETCLLLRLWRELFSHWPVDSWSCESTLLHSPSVSSHRSGVTSPSQPHVSHFSQDTGRGRIGEQIGKKGWQWTF